MMKNGNETAIFPQSSPMDVVIVLWDEFASSSFMQNRQNNKVDVIEGEIV
jgi:virulence-associated protein VagC